MHSIFYFCFGKYIPFMLNYAFCLFCAIFLATKKYYYERKRFISKNNFTLRVKGIPREMNITETVGRLCVKEKEWTFYYNPFSNRWHLDKGEGPPWLWQPRMFFGIRHLVSSLLFFFVPAFAAYSSGFIFSFVYFFSSCRVEFAIFSHSFVSQHPDRNGDVLEREFFFFFLPFVTGGSEQLSSVGGLLICFWLLQIAMVMMIMILEKGVKILIITILSRRMLLVLTCSWN